MSDAKTTTDTTSAIDQAIANAQARKAAKGGASTAPASSDSGESKRPRLSDEEKAARTVAKDAERAAKKAERDAAREERKAAKASEKRTPHMSKVEKASAKLPTMSDAAQASFNEITANLPAAQVANLAAHLQHFNRVSATERALSQKVSNGDMVTIISGDARYIGQTGTVTKAQRIRCYVKVEGAKKDVYLFTSDVEVTAVADAKQAKSA